MIRILSSYSLSYKKLWNHLPLGKFFPLICILLLLVRGTVFTYIRRCLQDLLPKWFVETSI